MFGNNLSETSLSFKKEVQYTHDTTTYDGKLILLRNIIRLHSCKE